MNHERDFPQILNEASKWAAMIEELALLKGSPLIGRELEDARAMGVRRPENVRVSTVFEMPCPKGGLLGLLNEREKMITIETGGLAINYAIFIRSDCKIYRRIFLHECAHVEQYERFGGIESFLKEYLPQCFEFGYPNAPLEKEADEKSRKYLALL